jgi:hypothetical protein
MHNESHLWPLKVPNLKKSCEKSERQNDNSNTRIKLIKLKESPDGLSQEVRFADEKF